jgi:hypothetical protein
MTRPHRLRLLVASLLVVSAVLFAIGVAAERRAEDDEERRNEIPAAVVDREAGEGGETEAQHAAEGDEAAEREAESGEEGGESAETGAAEGEGEGAGQEAAEHDEGNEELFGINTESTGAVAAAVTVSLLLAAAVWLWDVPAVLAIAVAFGLLFAAFDLREAFYQANESREGLVALALLMAVLHGAVALAAGAALKAEQAGRAEMAPT